MKIKHVGIHPFGKKLKTNRSKTRLVERKEQSARERIDKWILHLYIAGQTVKGVSAFNNLKIICKEQLKGNYQIKVIDILKNPQIAHDAKILAVPTLVRKFPLPERNIIGDLSNRERVLIGLDIIEDSTL